MRDDAGVFGEAEAERETDQTSAHFPKSRVKVGVKKIERLYRSLVSQLESTPDGVVWVGTRAECSGRCLIPRGGGLARYDNGDWSIFHRFNSDLPDNYVSALATDSSGVLWIETRGFPIRGEIHGGGMAELYKGKCRVFTTKKWFATRLRPRDYGGK